MKRATVYFDPHLHRALRIKAAETDRSVSELVNEAIRHSLAEDAEDLAAFEARAESGKTYGVPSWINRESDYGTFGI